MAASKTELEQVTAGLVNPNIPILQRALNRLPAWMDSLRGTTVQKLISDVSKACKGWLAAQALELHSLDQSHQGDQVVEALREFCQTVNAARPLVPRVPDLGTVLVEAQDLLKQAQEHQRSVSLHCALRPFLSVPPTRTSVTEEKQLIGAFADEMLNAAHISQDVVQEIETAFNQVTTKLGERSADKGLSEESMAHIIALLSCATKMHHFLGGAGDFEVREVVLENPASATAATTVAHPAWW